MILMRMILLYVVLTVTSNNLFAQEKASFEIKVDPRVEVLAVVQSLTQWPEVGAFTKLEFEYYSDVKEHFGKYKDHPAVNWFQDNLFQGWSYDAPPKGMLHLSQPPEMKIVIPFSEDLIKRGKGEENLKKMVEVLNQFIKDTDFMEFYADHRSFYTEFVDRTKNQVPFEEYTKLMIDFYGESKSKFVFLMAPLFHRGGYSGSIETPKEEISYYFGGPHKLDDGFPVYSTDSVRRLVFHEFGHTFVNPVVYELSEELEKYNHFFKYMEKNMKMLAYGNWLTVCHEHLVRTGESILLDAAGFKEEAEENYNDNFTGYGFELLPFFTEKLEGYKNNRQKYKDFRSYFPELIKVFDEVEWVTYDGPGPMNFAINLNLEECEIVRIQDNTPFALAGGKAGDKVAELGGFKFNANNFTKIKNIWENSNIGDEFDVVFVRDGKKIESRVKIPKGKVSKFVKK